MGKQKAMLEEDANGPLVTSIDFTVEGLERAMDYAEFLVLYEDRLCRLIDPNSMLYQRIR